MEKFTTINTVAIALDRPNVDTDLIIPKQFLKRIERAGFGQFVFNDLRFLPNGSANPDSLFNQPRYQGAGVLVSRENFGCGSSREHAPWALMDFGFRAIISSSFANIFENNSFKNGLILIVLSAAEVDRLIKLIEATVGYQLKIDLPSQTVSGPGFSASFNIDPFRKEMLLNGWDDISLTLKKKEKISAYEATHQNPWQAAVSMEIL